MAKVDQCLYKGYRRKGRKDMMSMVLLNDVLNHCEHWFLPYCEYEIPIDKL